MFAHFSVAGLSSGSEIKNKRDTQTLFNINSLYRLKKTIVHLKYVILNNALCLTAIQQKLLAHLL